MESCSRTLKSVTLELYVVCLARNVNRRDGWVANFRLTRTGAGTIPLSFAVMSTLRLPQQRYAAPLISKVSSLMNVRLLS